MRNLSVILTAKGRVGWWDQSVRDFGIKPQEKAHNYKGLQGRWSLFISYHFIGLHLLLSAVLWITLCRSSGFPPSPPRLQSAQKLSATVILCVFPLLLLKLCPGLSYRAKGEFKTLFHHLLVATCKLVGDAQGCTPVQVPWESLQRGDWSS